MATYRIEPPVGAEPDDSPGPVAPPFDGTDATVDDILDSALTSPS